MIPRRQLAWQGATHGRRQDHRDPILSTKSFEDAIKAGIARAEKTLRNLSGAWIKGQKVVIEKGKITEYRVLLKVTFVLQD
jgi:hypothetical protein